uniref:Asteroid homolog 1 n=1 Tax=Serinus canaria TaxID=9135 RepID=A0A8C9MF57_SERCA
MGVQGLTGFVEERGVFFTELRVRDTKLVIDGSSLYHHLCFAPRRRLPTRRRLRRLHRGRCFAEADREIAGLASSWGCPVLSLDSDFFVFDLAGGYCPLSHFQWRSVRAAAAPQGCFVPARCFSAERFCRHFGSLSKALLPLFAVMHGNDFVGLEALEAFFSKVRLPRGCAAGRGGKHLRLQGLLNWLAQFAEPGEAVDNVLKYLKKHQREEIRELLCTSMEDYAPSDVNLEDFFQNGSYECEAARKADVPQWVLDALAKGKLAPFVINALILRSTFLRVQVENMQRPSAHSAALPIRQVIYGLLLRVSHTTEGASPCKQTNELPIVCEFDRCQKTLKKTFVRAAKQHLQNTRKTQESCTRLMLLLETLGVKMSSLESIPSHLQLPVAVTCYWIRCSEPKVKLNQLKALLLMIVSGELQRIIDDPGMSTKNTVLDDSVAYNDFLKWKEKKLQNNDFDLDAAHSFCQWQCCLQMGLYLNQLLGTLLSEPDLSRSAFHTSPWWNECVNMFHFLYSLLLSRLYTGTLVHRLYQELKSAPSVENLFISSPKMAQLYLVLLNTVESMVSPDFFQEMTKTRSESCKKKIASSKKKPTTRRAVPETQHSCNVNRFAALEVDD